MSIRPLPRCDWAAPEPLTLDQARIAYPLAAMPEIARNAVTEVQKCVKSPIELVVGSALGAMSIATQAHYDVQRAHRLAGPVSVYLLQIAESGERKSKSDEHFTKPIEDWEADREAKAKIEHRAFDSEMDTFHAKREGLLAKINASAKSGKESRHLDEKIKELDASQPEKPQSPNVLLQDETPESLVSQLSIWPTSAFVSSEAGLVFGSHAMKPEVIVRNLSLLNVLWDGSSLKIGRKSSGRTKLRNARLTISLQAQSEILRDFIRKSGALARGCGFFSRFLLAWPVSTQGTRFFEEPPELLPALNRFHARTIELLETAPNFDKRGGISPTLLELSPEAKGIWRDYHDDVERELSTTGKYAEIRDVASKSAENAARLAAIFHAFESSSQDAISPSAMESATKIAAWHLSESIRFFSGIQPPQQLRDAVDLDLWLIKECHDHQTTKVRKQRIQQYITPARLRKNAMLSPAIAELESLNRVRRIREGGRESLEINPHLLR